MRVGWQLALYATVLCLSIVEATHPTAAGGQSTKRGEPPITEQPSTGLIPSPSHQESATGQKTTDPSNQCCGIEGSKIIGVNDLRGKMVVIIDADKDAFRTAHVLLNNGARVCIICKSHRVCREATNEVKRSEPQHAGRIEWLPRYSLSLKDVRERCGIWSWHFKTWGGIDVLIFNADKPSKTFFRRSDGFKINMVKYYLAPWTVIHFLLSRLKEKGGRIIIASSEGYENANLDVENLKKNEAQTYANSQSARLLLTRELARRLEGTGVTVNVVTFPIAPKNHNPLEKSPSIICLAAEEKYEHQSGGIFDTNCKVRRIDTANTYTEARAKTLWKSTLDLKQLKDLVNTIPDPDDKQPEKSATAKGKEREEEPSQTITEVPPTTGAGSSTST